MLEQVGAGRDTPERLSAEGAAIDEVLLALSELELMGLLARGDGGRYLPRDALLDSASARTVGQADEGIRTLDLRHGKATL